MALLLTKEEKSQLLQNLRALKAKHSELLRREARRVSKRCEKNVARRLNKVSVTVRSVRVQDVLDLERKQSPTLKDVQQLAETESNE